MHADQLWLLSVLFSSIFVITLLPIRLVVIDGQVALCRVVTILGVRFAPLDVKCHMHLVYSISNCMTCH